MVTVATAVIVSPTISMKSGCSVNPRQTSTIFYLTSRSRHTRWTGDWSSDVCSSDLTVLDPPEAHLCCGSAGTYNLMQPAIADQLRVRKVANLESTRPEIVAAGNIGCIAQIASGTDVPVVHTVELLDWATGGPKPPALA